MLKAHYEKLILLISVLLVLILGLQPLLSSMFSDGESPKSTGGSAGESFYFGENESGLQTLELPQETGLMPGDVLTFVPIEDDDGNEEKAFKISKVILENRSSLTVGFEKKEIIGKLMSGSDIVLDTDWKNLRSPLEIDSEEGRTSIAFSKINYIIGERLIAFDNPVEEFDSEEWRISLHQPLRGFKVDDNLTKPDRVRWTKPSDESGDSIYDLFTPPIIYLIDGNLTTSRPEKVEVRKTEEFGLSLISFQKKPYRFKMRGFSNVGPYFEDLDPSIKDMRLNPKTRIELNKPYSFNANGTPGSPSLIKTSEDDEKKLFMVKFFKVEYIKDDKTGGVKPVGRALVHDYKLGGKSFEINSRMQEVFAGENKIELNFSLDGPSEQVYLTDKDLGKVLEFGTRKYLIKEINVDEKSLLIEKQASPPNKPRTVSLTLP